MALLTLFTTCKPFEGASAIHQENALRSWAKLGLPVVIIGDETGSALIAAETAASHVKIVARNEDDLPRVDSLFDLAKQETTTPYLAYLNSDIILTPDFLKVIELLQQRLPDQKILIVSRRRNIPLSSSFDFADMNWAEHLEALDATKGSWDYPYAIDLFVFNRTLFSDIPSFSIGRPMWDNWMLWRAETLGATIVDMSEHIRIMHPIHGYEGGWQDVTHGSSASKNRSLGPVQSNDIASTATHYVTDNMTLSPLDDDTVRDRQSRFTPDNHKELRAYLDHVSTDQVQLSDKHLDDIRAMLWRWQRFFPLQDEMQPSAQGLGDLITEMKNLCADGYDSKALRAAQAFFARRLVKAVHLARGAGRKVYIWGAGQYGRRLNWLMEALEAPIDGFVDRNHTKFKTDETVLKPIMDPATLVGGEEPTPYILIGTMYFQQVIVDLETMGFNRADYAY